MLATLEGVYRCTKLYLEKHENPEAYRSFVHRQIQKQMIAQLTDSRQIIEEEDGDTITFRLALAVFDPEDVGINQIAIQRVRELLDKTAMTTKTKSEALEVLELIERRHCP